MAEDGFMWIYLVFFMIPLARVIPRIIRKWKNKDNPIKNNQFEENFQKMEPRQEVYENPNSFESKEFENIETKDEPPLSNEMKVLGEINRGIKDFNHIQNNLKIENQELENILKKFEDEGLMRVINKSGLTGNKIELFPTEKGFKKFNR
ncbi:MAG: hypothetical protein HOK63_00030 [Thaumarchaeota archaeon]|nr:hypothetical protein [Nitrososphaerota archaeon]MBT5843149.1 hypothetical protein [Nitrososphaerota archaeon]MBT6468031.1 hypothetical protein [Nitrososphaerota archaeon]